MSQDEFREKFRTALKYLNSATQHLSLAWEFVQKAGDFNSAGSLFLEFKEQILYSGDFKELYLFLGTRDGFLKIGSCKENMLIGDKTRFKTIDDIKTELEEKHDPENIQLQKIIYEDEIYGVLVAITKVPPEMITYNSLGLLNLFLQFIRLKIIEIRERNFREYSKVIYEKSILINEHLVLQERWTGKLSNLIEQISDIQKDNGKNLKNYQISKLLEELKSGIKPLQNLNWSTRDIVRSFGYYEAQTPVFLEKDIKSLFREVQAYFSPESMNHPFMENEVVVDPEQVNEGIKQVVNILNSFSNGSKAPLEIRPYTCNGKHVRFGIGSSKIKSCLLEKLDKGERQWSEKGPVITGFTLKSNDLAVKLIEKSKGNLRINKGGKDGLPGFEIDLQRSSSKENE